MRSEAADLGLLRLQGLPRAAPRLGALFASLLVLACGGGGSADGSGGSSGATGATGGSVVASGGATSSATGGSTVAQGGSAQPGSGGAATSNGGSPVSSGGISAGGAGTGTTGGSGTGGVNSSGGTPAGGAPASGGNASGGRANGGSAGSSAGAATGGATAGTGGSATGGGGNATGGGANGALSFTPAEGIYSYPRTTANGPSQTFRLMNGGASAATVNLSLGGTTPGAFRITSPTTLTNVMLAAGASVDLAVQFVPNGTGVAAAPAADNGGVALNALLSVAGAGPAVQANLFGLVMTIAGEGSGAEPTLGQILTTLGYAVDVGTGLRDHLANSTSTALQGSEVAMPRFVRAATGSVTLRLVARFSPSGAMPFGYYTVAAPNCANATSYAANCHVVGSMTTNTDANTSNGSRMLNPPVDSAGATGSFDPGSDAFGIWSYTDQASQKVSTGGTATNGDYAYSENALNIPSSMHRVRVWPLRDRAGAALSNSYLIGVEEASNGDYQDYVFVITNVKAP